MGNVRNLEWRNFVRRKLGTISQIPLQILAPIPRLWHKNKRREGATSGVAEEATKARIWGGRTVRGFSIKAK